MSTTATDEVELPTDLVEQVKAMTAAQRDRLADLLTTLDQPPADDPELVRKEWREVIADRIDGYLSGRYKTVDAMESIQRIREQFLKDHPQ